VSDVVSGQGSRDAHLDNVKLVLIGLVVLGHALGPLRGDSDVARAVYLWIYAFHMPAFVFLAGYLTKPTLDPDRARRLAGTVVVPYVVFQALYLGVDRAVAEDPAGFSLLRPYWLLWFLAALLIWRLSAPLMLAVRGALPISIVLALGAGFSSEFTRFLALNRAVGLAPFFVAGLLASPRPLTVVRRPAIQLASLVTLSALAVAAWQFREVIPWGLVSWTDRYDALTFGDTAVDAWMGMLARALLLTIAAAATAAVVSLTPTSRRWYTVLGAGSIGGYLLHGLVVLVAEERGWYQLLAGWWRLPVVGLLAAVLTALSCSPRVVRSLQPLLAPGWSRRRAAGPAGVTPQVASSPPEPVGAPIEEPVR
jgi:fucose 4-O-acetylase-like acetyltransferase